MKSILLPFFIFFLHTDFQISSGVSIIDSNLPKNEEFSPMVKRVCDEKMVEYSQDEMMESEISRRVLLMEKKYISYETLKRDLVPCGTPGASYYNCKGKGVANTYNRGCEIITRCARDAINT
ncbi:protein RALF-like 24 [Rutidosis leptorrhynchoides]|uniref:protein RALF-like 24 n=1 Tax=Rutidosis leptorrhynchoides TaxID=125765 RepID=UPI003A9A4856